MRPHHSIDQIIKVSPIESKPSKAAIILSQTNQSSSTYIRTFCYVTTTGHFSPLRDTTCLLYSHSNDHTLKVP